MVFVDGQNVYKCCSEIFRHPYCHPLLLARHLAGGRRLAGVRYYSGIHDPRVNPELNARIQRRHDLIRRSGVTVIPRMLRYRWEWGLNAVHQRELPDARAHEGEERQVTVSPYQRAREKGIDVALALDVVDLAQKNYMDVAILVSGDTDLSEVARVVHDVTRTSPTGRVSVEAAVITSGRRPIVLSHYDYTHQVRGEDFGPIRDDFDYTAPLNRADVDAFLRVCWPGSSGTTTNSPESRSVPPTLPSGLPTPTLPTLRLPPTEPSS